MFKECAWNAAIIQIEAEITLFVLKKTPFFVFSSISPTLAALLQGDR